MAQIFTYHSSMSISSPLDFVATRTNTQPPLHLSLLHTRSPRRDQQIHKYIMSSANTNTMEIESSEYVHAPSAFACWNETTTSKQTNNKQAHIKKILLNHRLYSTHSVIRLVQQFLKENNLLRTLSTLQASKNTIELLFTP